MNRQNEISKIGISGYAITGFIFSVLVVLISGIWLGNSEMFPYLLYVYIVFLIISIVFNIIGLFEIRKKIKTGKWFAIIGIIISIIPLIYILLFTTVTPLGSFLYTLF
jgi:hypothetical protein